MKKTLKPRETSTDFTDTWVTPQHMNGIRQWTETPITQWRVGLTLTVLFVA